MSLKLPLSPPPPPASTRSLDELQTVTLNANADIWPLTPTFWDLAWSNPQTQIWSLRLFPLLQPGSGSGAMKRRNAYTPFPSWHHTQVRFRVASTAQPNSKTRNQRSTCQDVNQAESRTTPRVRHLFRVNLKVHSFPLTCLNSSSSTSLDGVTSTSIAIHLRFSTIFHFRSSPDPSFQSQSNPLPSS